MKTLLLGTFALFVILSQVACSDDSSGATAAYAAANNCTIGADGQQVTGAAAAAQSQVPCSLQNASKIASTANLANVAAAQVSPGAAISTASVDSAVKAQSAKVQAQLAALDADKPLPLVKTESIDTSRTPASIGAAVDAPNAIEGGGDIIR